MGKLVNDNPKRLIILSAPGFDPLIQIRERPEHFEAAHFLILLTPEIKKHGLFFLNDIVPVDTGLTCAKHRPKRWIKGKGEDLIQKRCGEPGALLLPHGNVVVSEEINRRSYLWIGIEGLVKAALPLLRLSQEILCF